MLKIQKSISGEDFLKILQKLVLRIWNQYCQQDKETGKYIYILKELRATRKEMMGSWSPELDYNTKKTKISSTWNAKELSDIINLSNSTVNVVA